MKRLFTVICSVLLLGTLNSAATAQAVQEERYTGRVRVESAFTRVLPDFDAEPLASLFEGDIIEVISRNLDGTWFEVQRPGRLNKLGWVYSGTLEWDFAPEYLPLGDIQTRITGPSPLNHVPDFAAYFIEAPVMRQQPLHNARPVQPPVRVPPDVTLPVLARNQDGSWLFVNYLGHQGWVIAFTTRSLPNVTAIPQAANLPPLQNLPTEIIPVELQQAQIDRLRGFILERMGYAQGLEAFWWQVFRGEIMPCEVPPEFANYPYTAEDVRHLPELQRHAPRVGDAIAYLSTAREPLLSCGVISPRVIIQARNASINARVIFDATLEALDRLERNVVQTRR